MCITSGPAELFNTQIAAWVKIMNDKLAHGLIYKNSAVNLNNAPANSDRPGNSMVIPIPAVKGTLNRTGFMNLERAPNVLNDMIQSAQPRSRGFRGGIFSMMPKGVEVFENGIYTVFLSETPTKIPEAIEIALGNGMLQQDKAPAFQPDLLAFFQEEYGWPVAVFCFNNKTPQESQPVGIVYKPRYPQYLFAPAVDSHSGGAPNLTDAVEVDHNIIFGCDDMLAYQGEVEYTDPLTSNQLALLPTRVATCPFSGMYMDNGDFVASVEAVRAGHPEYSRQKPSFWRSL